MKKTGEILRKSREEKGLSLHEVGIFLKINTRILQAIEDGDIEKLPAKTFLRGFVQSYAKYLKLDPNYVLKIFSEELKPPFVEAEALLEEKLTANKEELTNQPTDAVGTVEPEVSSPASEKKTSLYVGTSVGSDSIKQKMLIISVLGFFLVFIVYIGNSLIRRYQKEASLNVDVPVVETAPKHTTPETLLSSPPAAAGSSISALPTVSTGSPLASPTAPSTPSDSKKKEETKPSEPVSSTSPPITPANNSTTTLPTVNSTPEMNIANPVVVAAVAPTNPAPTEKKIPEGKPLEVIIEAKENVEIEYSSARTTPQKLLLKGEQIHTFKSRSGVRLKISNGGAVNVIVNGQDLGAPGAQGQSIQLNYE